MYGPSLIIAVFLSPGCMGRVDIHRLAPPAVAIPDKVETVAVLDRSRARLSSEATADMAAHLALSPRYEVADLSAGQAALDRHESLPGIPLSRTAAAAICAETGATGLVVLELMEDEVGWDTRTRSITRIRTEEILEGALKRVEEHRGEELVHDSIFTLQYEGFWSTCGCDGRVLDSHTVFSHQVSIGEGANPTEARSNVGDQSPLHYQAAAELALGYARRISPDEEHLVRRYYRGGSPAIREGAAALRAGDRQRAEEAWRLGAGSPQPEARGKALYNLAVLAEEQGRLDEARAHIDQAARLLQSRPARRYQEEIYARSGARDADMALTKGP